MGVEPFLNGDACMDSRLKGFLITLVVIVWAINMSAPIWNPDYKPPPELNVAFMAVVGVLTAAKTNNRDREE